MKIQVCKTCESTIFDDEQRCAMCGGNDFRPSELSFLAQVFLYSTAINGLSAEEALRRIAKQLAEEALRRITKECVKKLILNMVD